MRVLKNALKFTVTLTMGCLVLTKPNNAVSQSSDTIKIDRAMVNTKFLLKGTHQYLVYYRNGKDSSRVNYEFWSRSIDTISYQGRNAIFVKQEWENNKTVFHKAFSVCDKISFEPLYHESWWKDRGNYTFDFINEVAVINGRVITEEDTAKRLVSMHAAFKKAVDQYTLNWHLDLEVFPLLPYKENRTFLINFYDPGFPAPSYHAYTVIGSDSLKEYENESTECWLLSHEESYGKEVFWISKKSQEVLKLEQTINNRMYRYKVKFISSP